MTSLDATDRPDAGLDRALADAFAVDPPPEIVASVDVRVSAAIANARAAAGARRQRPSVADRLRGVRRLSWRGRAVGLLAAAIVLGGAGGGALRLYDWMIGSDNGWRTAWDRAAVLGASQTVDGYRVTLERAYADPTQLMLAITVTDVQNRGWTQVATYGADVTDERGLRFSGSMGMSTPDGPNSAANIAWLAPPAGLTPGPHTLHVTVPTVAVRDSSTPPPDEATGASAGAGNEGSSTSAKADRNGWNPWHEVAGPWTFSVDINVAGGSTVAPGATATVNGVTVRLTQVTVAPSAVSATIAVSGAAGSDWFPVGSFRHGSATFPINRGGGGKDAALTFQTEGGAADAAGEWTLQVDELVGLTPDGNGQDRLQGPWRVTFTMP